MMLLMIMKSTTTKKKTTTKTTTTTMMMNFMFDIERMLYTCFLYKAWIIVLYSQGDQTSVLYSDSAGFRCFVPVSRKHFIIDTRSIVVFKYHSVVHSTSRLGCLICSEIIQYTNVLWKGNDSLINKNKMKLKFAQVNSEPLMSVPLTKRKHYSLII